MTEGKRNAAESTSLRAEIHATDSTWEGWTAKRSAAMKASQKRPKSRRTSSNASTESSAWRRICWRWYPNGFSPQRL